VPNSVETANVRKQGWLCELELDYRHRGWDRHYHVDVLSESIRCYGVLSPLLAHPKGEGYELVSGHRRCLAAQKLSLETVPVFVWEMSDDEAVILAVDSNWQREQEEIGEIFDPVKQWWKC